MLKFLILFSIVTGFKECTALSKVSFDTIPKKVNEGDDIELTCTYDLGSDELYIIRWIKNQQELAIYNPAEVSPTKVFPLKNVTVDVSASTAHKLKLLNVTKGAEGLYTCEIYTIFLKMKFGEKYINVIGKQDYADEIYTVDLPTYDPVVMPCPYPITNTTALKSVVWRHNGKIFYKYEPGTEFNVDLEKMPGLNISVKQKSNTTELILRNVTADTEGEYTCIVDYGTEAFRISAILFVRDVTSKSVTVTVPPMVIEGENVQLKCRYNFDQADIMSVKWFKGTREFYSFKPGEDPTITSFDGVDVQDLTNEKYRSFASVVLLQKVNFDTVGFYRCEVSTKNVSKPFSKSGVLTLLRYPEGHPIVFVENNYLREGDDVRAKCASPPSHPPANVTWFLNNEEVSGQEKPDLMYRPFDFFPAITRSSLLHRVQFHENSYINLTCVVTFGGTYKKGKTVKIEKDLSRKSNVVEVRRINSDVSTNCWGIGSRC